MVGMGCVQETFFQPQSGTPSTRLDKDKQDVPSGFEATVVG